MLDDLVSHATVGWGEAVEVYITGAGGERGCACCGAGAGDVGVCIGGAGCIIRGGRGVCGGGG